MTAYVSRSLTPNFPCWSEYLVPNPHSSPTSISTSGPDHVTFSHPQRHIHSQPHMCTCASSHAHTQHTHIHVPQAPSILPPSLRGSREEPPEDKASWASMPTGTRGGFSGQPLVWAELLGGPSSSALAQAPPFQEVQPLPSRLTPPKASPLRQVAGSGIWTLPAAASSQESRIAGWPSATGQLGKKPPSLGFPIRTPINPLLCIWLNRVNTDQVTPGGGSLD